MSSVMRVFVIFITLFSLSAMAYTDSSDYVVRRTNYHKEDDNLLFKIRGYYLNTQAKNGKFSIPKINNDAKIKQLVQHGYGFDTATTYFLTDNFATELSLGVGLMKTSSTALTSIREAYNVKSDVTLGKNHEIYFIPASATIQYHIAPFGAIRPYIGGGYNGTFMYTRSKMFKIDHAHGPVVQFGIDFVSKENTIITLDIRKFFLKPKITYKKDLITLKDQAEVNSKMDWSPWIISLGIGFQF